MRNYQAVSHMCWLKSQNKSGRGGKLFLEIIAGNLPHIQSLVNSKQVKHNTEAHCQIAAIQW